MNGFLGTGATFRADLNLVTQIAMGVALLAGLFWARKKNFRAHKYCQSSVMILNLLMIFLIMAPSFHKQVEPQIPGGLKEAQAKKVRAERPTRILEEAIRGMLPKTKLGRKQLKKLKVYRGSRHPHEAQRPRQMPLPAARRGIARARSAC